MALRCIYKRIPQIINSTAALPTKFQARHAGYLASTVVGEPTKYTEVEVSQDPEEWKFVERLMPLKIIPPPPVKDHYPSGWIPPKPESIALPFFIERTKNHLPPIYLYVFNRGQIRHTIIKKIHGDIWALHEDLRTYLQKYMDRPLASSVIEIQGMIKLKGDLVSLSLEWFKEKGF